MCFNRTLIRPILKKTPYELYKGRKPNISHLRVFGCKCFILNNGKDNLGKFDPKSDEGIHIGYVINGHAYRVYNKRLLAVEESIHVVFDETDCTVPKSVPRTHEMNIIGTKWVYRNKMDEHGAITRNKARLFAKATTKKRE